MTVFREAQEGRIMRRAANACAVGLLFLGLSTESARGADAPRRIAVRVITGSTDPANRKAEDLAFLEKEGFQISLAQNLTGPPDCESDVDNTFGAPGLVQLAANAEKDGVDAIVIESMGDTALRPCREVVSIPVVGMSDTSLRVATMLGRRIGMITAKDWHARTLEDLARAYGIGPQQLVAVRPAEIVPFSKEGRAKLLSNLVAAALPMIDQEGVDTIVLGGSYFTGYEGELRDALREHGHEIVVIDPLALAIRFTRVLVDSKLAQSKLIYARPKSKPVVGYSELQRTP